MIDRSHDLNRFTKGNDNLLVVLDVFGTKLATFTVFEPFVADLVAADVEVPDGFGDLGEGVALFVDDDVAVDEFWLSRINHTIAAVVDEFRLGFFLGELRGFHQVQLHEFFAEGGELGEQGVVACEWDAGEVDFEEVGVAGAVDGGMEEGVDIVEDGFGGGGVAEAIGDVVEEWLGEVGAAGHAHSAFSFGFGVEVEWEKIISFF